MSACNATGLFVLSVRPQAALLTPCALCGASADSSNTAFFSLVLSLVDVDVAADVAVTPVDFDFTKNHRRWLAAFAADCRCRIVSLLGHEFQGFDCTTGKQAVL